MSVVLNSLNTDAFKISQRKHCYLSSVYFVMARVRYKRKTGVKVCVKRRFKVGTGQRVRGTSSDKGWALGEAMICQVLRAARKEMNLVGRYLKAGFPT